MVHIRVLRYPQGTGTSIKVNAHACMGLSTRIFSNCGHGDMYYSILSIAIPIPPKQHLRDSPHSTLKGLTHRQHLRDRPQATLEGLSLKQRMWDHPHATPAWLALSNTWGTLPK